MVPASLTFAYCPSLLHVKSEGCASSSSHCLASTQYDEKGAAAAGNDCAVKSIEWNVSGSVLVPFIKYGSGSPHVAARGNKRAHSCFA